MTSWLEDLAMLPLKAFIGATSATDPNEATRGGSEQDMRSLAIYGVIAAGVVAPILVASFAPKRKRKGSSDEKMEKAAYATQESVTKFVTQPIVALPLVYWGIQLLKDFPATKVIPDTVVHHDEIGHWEPQGHYEQNPNYIPADTGEGSFNPGTSPSYGVGGGGSAPKYE